MKAQVIIKDEMNVSLVGLSQKHYTKLYDAFGIQEKNCFFMPSYKLGRWDGYYRFVSQQGNTCIYFLDQIIPRLVKWGYELEVTDKRIAGYIEFDPISEDIFAHVNNPYGDPYMLRWYQCEAVNAVVQNGGGIMIAGTGAGKDQPLDSKILTPSGWKRMGDMAVGDIVCNPDGTTTDVTGVFPQEGLRDVYEVEFDDGSVAKCGYEHLWQIIERDDAANEVSHVLTTEDIKRAIDNPTGSTLHIPTAAPANTQPHDLSVNPYLIGAMVVSELNSLTTVQTSNREVVNVLRPIADMIHCRIEWTTSTQLDIHSPSHVYDGYLKVLDQANIMSQCEYGLIPMGYATGSIDQRLSVVQGMMDCAGRVYSDGSAVSIDFKNIQAANQFRTLIWSLGSVCYIVDHVDGAFECVIEGNDLQRFFKTNILSDLCQDSVVERLRSVVRVSKVSTEPTQCISVGHDNSLYITDDYVVTHNTIISAAITHIYSEKDMRCIVIVPSTTLVSQSSDDFKLWGINAGQFCGDTKELDRRHLVTTWQSLQNVPHILKNYDVLIVDECHGAKANVLASLLRDHGGHIAHRYGMTGTMPKDEIESLKVLMSLGSVQYQITAAMLIEQGFLSTIQINIMQLYEEFDDKYFPDYASEMNYLRTNPGRLKWIADLATNVSSGENGNTMILVGNITFGKKLAKILGAHFVYGADKNAVRKEAYDLFKSETNVIVITTVQVAGTGLSIDRIFHLIVVDLGKSFIRTIQAIGRGLRKNEKAGKTHCEVYDVCSNLKYSRQHLRDRVKYYKESEYPNRKMLIKNYDDIVD